MIGVKIALEMRMQIKGIVRNNHAFQNKMPFNSKSWDEIDPNLKRRKLFSGLSERTDLPGVFKKDVLMFKH